MSMFAVRFSHLDVDFECQVGDVLLLSARVPHLGRAAALRHQAAFHFAERLDLTFKREVEQLLVIYEEVSCLRNDRS